MLKIIRGLPASFVVVLKDGDTQVNLNDGSWDITATMHYQTEFGRETDWPLTLTPSANSIILEFDSTQTESLKRTDLGYIVNLAITSSDNLTVLKTKLRIPVLNGL